MTTAELYDALDGLFAYDTGSVDSGIHDELLRERVIAHLKGLSDDERIAVLGDFVRTTYTAEAGFTEEDGMEFAEWLSDRMGIAP
jgi:hypothetical protein